MTKQNFEKQRAPRAVAAEARLRVAKYASLGFPNQQIARQLGINIKQLSAFYAQELLCSPIADPKPLQSAFPAFLPPRTGLIVTGPNGERSLRDLLP